MIHDEHIEYVKNLPHKITTLMIEIDEQKFFIRAEPAAAAELLRFIKALREHDDEIEITIASNDYSSAGDLEVCLVKKNELAPEPPDPMFF